MCIFSLTIYYSQYNGKADVEHLRLLSYEKQEGDVPKTCAIWFTCSCASIISITELFNSVLGAVSSAFFFVTLSLIIVLGWIKLPKDKNLNLGKRINVLVCLSTLDWILHDGHY